ncbi:hypothetical protein [Streptomyces sp. NPDC054829]
MTRSDDVAAALAALTHTERAVLHAHFRRAGDNWAGRNPRFATVWAALAALVAEAQHRERSVLDALADATPDAPRPDRSGNRRHHAREVPS